MQGICFKYTFHVKGIRERENNYTMLICIDICVNIITIITILSSPSSSHLQLCTTVGGAREQVHAYVHKTRVLLRELDRSYWH